MAEHLGGRGSVRTSTRQASRLEPGDRLMLMGIRVAVVQKVESVKKSTPLRFIDRGRSAPKEPVYWTKIHLVWENHPGPKFAVIIEGDKFVSLRDTNPD